MTKKTVVRKRAGDEEISPVRVTMEKLDATLPMYRCRHCNHEWVPRQNVPIECPNCKRRNWYGSKSEEAEFED
jgi:rubrerythrin